MPTIQTVVLFALGLGLVIVCAEKLVKAAVGTARGFGLSAFLVSVIFIGFDPENLGVGAVASWEGVSGIALGTVIGAAMVAIALAFGITALLAPMRFQQVPRRILLVPVLAVLWLGALALDGELSRADGVLLLVGFVLALLYLTRLTRRGLDIRPGGEVAETLAEQGPVNRWQSLGLLLLSLAGIVVGSELLVLASQSLLEWLGLSDTVFGMTVLALAVSVEELARELPAAWQGRPEISFGNVAGSILAFFLCNAGVIALVRPIPVPAQVLWFYFPVCLGTVVVLSLLMLTLRVPRWAGGVLVALYLVFVAGGYLGYGLP
ncbi:MAG: sodium:calcium antiporter [Gemmataceae bacterium]|nr:sodium:calcium antiporter [Gemmataceae bacterium]